MNFFRYVERRYANSAATLSKEFNLKDDATTKAASQWSNSIRWAGKWYMVFGLMFDYWLYRFGVIAEPIDIIAKTKADMEIAKKSMAKKCESDDPQWIAAQERFKAKKIADESNLSLAAPNGEILPKT